MPSLLKPLILALLVAALAAGARVETAEAKIESNCARALIHDWYVDGRVDRTYPVRCYREALRDIPEDQIVYGTLREDLERALQSVIRSNDGDVDGDTPVPGAGGGGDGTSGGSGDEDEGWITSLARKLGPDTADSIPVPLLVLGGLALLLMAAAGVSFLARRTQAKRAGPNPPPNAPL
jgi:hypothetical protein